MCSEAVLKAAANDQPDPALLVKGSEQIWRKVLQHVCVPGQQILTPMLSWLETHQQDLAGGSGIVRLFIVQGQSHAGWDSGGSIQLICYLQAQCGQVQLL